MSQRKPAKAAAQKTSAKPRKRSAKRSRAVYARSTSGQLVVNVPPPPRKLPKSTRVFQALFFVPFLMIELWFAWAFVLETLANCGYTEAYILPNWCQPNGKFYVLLLLTQAIALIFLGVFAARLAYRQGIRWRFLAIYMVTLLVGQYMTARLLTRLFF